jgi:phospholipid transport system transporter-binding protein
MAVRSNGASATVEVVEASPGQVRVSGALTFDTARRAREAALRILKGSTAAGPLVVDCAGVQESDSAGLAVLIDLLRNAGEAGRAVSFTNIPPGIRAAADISESAAFLGI